MSEWISVEDELPEGPDDYIICYETIGSDKRFVDVGTFFQGNWNQSIFYRWNVTHWMKKPEPPEKKKKHHKCVSFDFTCEYVDYLKSLVISNKNDKIACEVLVCPFCGITKEDL